MTYRVLELFCNAGGSAMGWHRAGFDVVGVDIAPQPRFPFKFHQADAFEFLAEHGHEFDVIAGGPECRDHTPLTSVAGFRGTGWQLPKCVQEFPKFGVPYVIENVMNARFDHDLVLCAESFGLRTTRHRKFKLGGFTVPQPPHPAKHLRSTCTSRRRERFDEGWNVSITGDVGTWVGPPCMGIDWMNGDELSLAIPPAYTEYIGGYLMKSLRENRI
jgi:DNA (cytosine-5)-methyltransferase 1